jgi:hypothetical protein
MYSHCLSPENPNQNVSVHKRILKLISGLLLVFSCAVTAQVDRYSFQVAGGTYTPITGGAIANVNDPTPYHIFLDFPVRFGFFSYNRILIADTGGLYFAVGSTVINPDNEFGNAISNSLGLAAIAPFSCNTSGYADREIRYQTLGTAPNRVLVIQWKGFKREYSAVPEKFEYQCRIYETTNKIDFIYGNFTNPTNLQLSGQTGAEVGLRGGTYPYPSLKNLTIDAGGSWTSPTVGTGNSQARCHYNGDTPNTKPTSGLTYRFSPYDLSVSILPLPAGCAPGEMTVRITNTGADVYDFAANPIGLSASVYPVTQNFTSLINTGALGVGAVRDVTFNGAFPSGIYYSLSAAISTPANDLNSVNNSAVSYPYVGTYSVPYNVPQPFTAQMDFWEVLSSSGNITPAVGSLGSNDEFRFTCKTTYQSIPGAVNFDILVSTNCGASYTTAYANMPVPAGANGQSESNMRVSLAAYAGQTVMLKFIPKVFDSPYTITFTNMRFDHAAPPCVTNMLPANGTTTVGTNVTVSWNASIGATSYDVYRGTAANALTLVYNTAQTSYTSTLLPLTQYFWRVIPRNAVTATIGDDCTTTGTFTTSIALTDLSVTEIVVPKDCPHTGNILVTVKNVGISAINFGAGSASLNVSKTGPSTTENFASLLNTGILAPNESRQVSVPNANFNTSGTHAITATVYLSSDAFQNNNSMTFSKIIGAVQAIPFTLPDAQLFAYSGYTPSYVTPVTAAIAVGDYFAFDYKTVGYDPFSSDMRIEISTGCNDTYELLTTVPYTVSTALSGTIPIRIDLSAYAGQFAKVRVVVPGRFYQGLQGPGGNGHTTYFEHVRFNKTPACATGTSPANGANLLTDATPYQTAVLSWNPVPAATEYEVFFGTTPNPPYAGLIETTSYSPGLLLPGTQYYWKVLGRHADAIATGCITQTFTTGYCTPRTYQGTFGDRQITGVQLGTLNNQTGGAQTYPYHTFYSSGVPVPNIGQNQTITVTVTMGLSQNQYAAAWIDFNRNRIFEPSEGVASTSPTSFGGSTTLTFTVPQNAVVGQTVMRVRNAVTWPIQLNMSCGEVSTSLYGESEDYYVNITPSTVYAQCALTQSPANAATDVVLTDNSVTLSWAPVTIGLPVATYDVYAGTTEANMALRGNTTAASFPLTNLFHGTTYYWKVIPKTSSGVTALGCYVFSFTTHNPFLPYCSNIQYQYFTEPITNVTFAGINNTSTNATVPAPNNYGIQDFISITGTVTRGQTYPMTIKAAVSGYCYFQVYVDWNQNGNFDDAGESYYGGEMENSTGTDNFSTSRNITVPADALIGTTRMRVQKSGNYPTNPCSAGNTVGQIEDYSLTINPAYVECATIISPQNNGNPIVVGQNNDVTFSWTPSPTGPPATSYSLFFGLTADNLYSEIVVTGTSFTAGTAIGTTYYWKVVPHSALGIDPVNCPVYSFTPQGQYYPYCQGITFSNVYPITSVNFAGINNTSPNVDNQSQQNFISMTGNVIKESTYPMILKGYTGGNYTFSFYAFVDWNHDNDFDDAGETFDGGSVTNSSGTDAIQSLTNITIPANALTGMTRMRIKYVYDPNNSSCTAGSNYGQTEDYSLNVINCNGSLWYADADSDGFGNPAVSTSACSQPAGFVSNNTDCNDDNSNIHQSFPFFADADGDTYGNSSLVFVCAVDANTPPVGYAINNTDCNDSDNTVYQSATLYVDADSDGYTSGISQIVCYGVAMPSGFVATLTAIDCNDSIAAIHPNATEIPYNGIDDDCDGTIDETGTVTTTLLNTSCGTTLASIGSIIGITTLAGQPITGYRIRVTNGAQVQMIESNVPHFTMTQFASYTYATTYTVEIQLQRAGIWMASWGTPCLVSTPAILENGAAGSVNPSQCGITLSKINTLIATTSLQGVTGYRFRVTNLTDTVGPNAIQTLDRTQNWFSLQMLARYNYGTVYRIEVAVKTTADFGGFGAPCEVSSPASPSLTNCGGSIALKTTTIAATSLVGITQYRFQVTRQSDNASATIDRSVNWFNFNMVPAAAYTIGAMYTVRVAVMSTGTWSPFGDACEIQAPTGTGKGIATATIATASADFKAMAYPNPFTSNFGIDVMTSSQENVMLKIYDMLGKLVESREVKMVDLDLEKIGAQYPSGVYNVIVSQDGIVKTLRVIKR